MRNDRNAEKREAPAVVVDGRVPPHDLDAEAAVLSACMLDQGAMDSVVDILRPEHFYSEAHRRIFEACIDLQAQGKPVDIVQVGTWLKTRQRAESIGGLAYLTEILNAAPAVANARPYADTIVAKSKVRQVIATCQRVAAEGYVDYGDAQEYADAAASDLAAIAVAGTVGGLVPIKEPLTEAVAAYHRAISEGRNGVGTPTGFANYDRLTAGLHRKEVTIIAARPGVGKTSYAMQLAMQVAQRGEGVAFFSVEMPREQIVIRAACQHAGINPTRIRLGQMRNEDWVGLAGATTEIGKLPLYLDDQAGISPMTARARLRRWIAECRTKKVRPTLAIFDYLQLMRGKESPSREQEVSDVSRGLKDLSKDLDLSVIALAQLNRDVEKRGMKGKRPQLSDLRESGSIEQDAANVAFLWRADEDEKSDDRDTEVTLTLAKQRNGPTGEYVMRFEKRFTRFHCVEEDGRSYAD